MTIHEMQELNRDAMAHVRRHLCPGMWLTDVRRLAEDYLLSHGADSFWYWDVGAFVFSGEETVLSVSGRSYVTSQRQIRENDIITVDLSPQRDGVWGDYARTIVLENGRVAENTEDIQTAEWRDGLQMEAHLHREMRRFVTPRTTFEELYAFINEEILRCGYVNLDFLGNLGHSIVRNKADRIYTEKGSRAWLSSVQAFTFEPHIARPGSAFGYKMENIYAFDENGTLVEL